MTDTDATTDPTERPLTLQPPRGGVDPVAVVSIVLGVVALALMLVGLPTWVPLLLSVAGLFVAVVSVLGSRPSAARWLGLIAVLVSAVPFVVLFFVAEY
ncbi:MAG: hypothetical protein Q7T71_16895 [Herbiconiux sp.]|nr:hypothetical protein [Herbiconiux sp.]